MKFRFPRQRYGCVQCGKSCGQWRIWVEPELVESIQNHPLALELPVLEPEAGGWHRLSYDGEGRCKFLRPDLLCGLHASTGWRSKPRACRQFPFFLMETPDGLQVGLSFRCTAVQQDHGVDWSEHLADLEDLAGSGQYPRAGFEPARLGSVELPWPDYLQWEAEWIGHLDRGGPLSLVVYRRVQPFLSLLLDFASWENMLDHFSASAVALLEGDPRLAPALLQGKSYQSPRRGRVSACPQPFRGRPPAGRYLSHVLERKTLWLGPSFLGKLLSLLVAERLLRYYTQSLGEFSDAVELVEGEWVAHRDDLGPLEESLAATLLQFA